MFDASRLNQYSTKEAGWKNAHRRNNLVAPASNDPFGHLARGGRRNVLSKWSFFRPALLQFPGLVRKATEFFGANPIGSVLLPTRQGFIHDKFVT